MFRACSSLAHNYPQLANELFNAAFVSCWTELDETSRNDIVTALEQALTAPDCPELTQAVLNLAEFMEHCEKGALPISVKLLGEQAINCRAYAKALFYKVRYGKVIYLNPCHIININRSEFTGRRVS